MDNRVKSLCEYLDAAHSVYHAVDYLVQTLNHAGYTRLEEKNEWNILPGGKYFITRGGTAIIAFRVPKCTPKGFLMSASHSDRPSFKIKDKFELTGPYTRVAVERYGGMLISSWMDRPLSIAGRVVVETENGVEARLVDIDQDLLMIPNVAIHMNRQVNDGYKWNPAVDAIPVLGGTDDVGKLGALLEEKAGGKILGHDLYLYVRQKASVWGIDGEYISAQALDDLECVWSCSQGFLRAKESESIPMMCVFDAEEVGSASMQGAASTFLPDILTRICQGLDLDMYRMLDQSFMVSADNAHALHPNHPELADPANAPIMGGGAVLKYNASMSYCTDGMSAAVFRRICGKAGVPLQTFYNRADIPGGSTLGRISLGQISLPTVDVGPPQLAMHSCFETGAVADVIHLEQAMTAYFGTTLELHGTEYHLK